MTAETVPLVLDVYDGAGRLADRGSIVLIPSAAVSDTVNHQAIMTPVTVDLTTVTALGAPVTVSLRPTDDPGITPAGWAWTATFRNVPGVADGLVQSFALPWNGGATAYLSSVITVQNPVTFQAYMPVPSSQPTAGQVPVFTGTGYQSAPGAAGGGSGTVTSASVATANGFAGTVATATTTPAVTVSTTVSGLLKGNGTAVSAATAGADYVTPAGSGAALTGITAAQVGADASGAATTAQANAVAASAQRASNLSDLASAPTARANLGLGTAATQASSAFDASGAAAAAQTASLQKTSNLSDLASAGTARTNLGLGSAATQSSAAFDTAGAASAAQTAAQAYSSPATTLGDTVYGGASGVPARLAGNTAATRKFYAQTGNGTVSAIPAWATIGAGDLPLASLGVYNIRTYGGAAIDGATDDAAAWNTCIAAAQTAGGGIVFHPGGTSVVSSYPQVTGSNVIIRGIGAGSVILLAPASMTSSGQTIGVWVNGASNVIVEDLCVDGNFANIAKDGGTVVPSTFTGALNGAISTTPAAGTTETWTVNSAASTASAAYSAPFAVKVDSEFILVNGGYGTTSWTVRRGFGQGNGGGATAAHGAAAAISSTNGTLFDATITAYGSGTPKTYMSSAYAGGVDASQYLIYRMPIRITSSENVTVQRVLMRNSVSAGVLADATSVGGCADILIANNRIHHTWDNGVYFHKGVQYATATGNLISDAMYNCVSAVYCDHVLIAANNGRLAGPSFSDSGGTQVNGSANCAVIGNTWDRCQFYGVSAQSSNETAITGGAGGNEVYASDTIITGNLITNCHAADYSTHTAPGVNFNGAIDTIVGDNTIQACDYGVSMGQKSVRTTITGNRIALCTGFGVNVGNSADVIGTVVRGNVIVKNGNSGIYANAPAQVYDNIIAGNVNEGVQLASVPSGLARKTDYVIGNAIFDCTDSGVLCTAAAPSLAVIERNVFFNSQGVLFADGAANGTTTLTSATAAFTAADTGSVLIVLNQGTGGTTTATTIASVTNGTTVVLAATLPGTQSGLTFSVGRGPSYYADGSTTTASNSVLTSATAAFTANDAGLLVVLLSTDPTPVTLGVATVNSYTSATQVTLSADFGTLASCAFFINRSQGQMGKAVNNFSGNPVLMRGNTVYGIPEYQGAGGVVNAVQPSTQWLARRAVADHNYTLNQQDQLIAVTSLTATRTITLPAGFGTATLPYYLIVKDESGAAAANIVVLSVSGGGTVDGVASVSIAENYGQAYLYSTGSNWYTVAPSKGAAPANFKPAAPASTTSVTLVMMGVGSTCAFTPSGSGRVMVNVTSYAQSATSPAGINCGGRYGTGTAPANGVAVTGTRFGAAGDAGAKPNGTGANGGTMFAFTDLLALTPGTAYWFDLALLTSVGTDAASLANISMTLVELP